MAPRPAAWTESCVGTGMGDGSGVGVGDGVFVGLGAGVGVEVAVGAGVFVGVGVCVAVGVGVLVGTGVSVGVGVFVGTGVRVGVGIGVLVGEGEGVSDGVAATGTEVAVGDGRGCVLSSSGTAWASGVDSEPENPADSSLDIQQPVESAARRTDAPNHMIGIRKRASAASVHLPNSKLPFPATRSLAQ